MKFLRFVVVAIIVHAGVFISKGNARVGYICNSNSRRITCSNSTVIHILEAKFGREISNSANERCNGSLSDINSTCFDDVTKVIRSNCARRPYCMLDVRQNYFRRNNLTKCPKGSRKYLEFQYECVSPTGAPYQDNPTTCTWLAGQSQICKVSFYASTNVTVGQITKDGSLVDGIVSPVSRDGDDLVLFHFGLLKVTFDDAGSYQVHMTSIVPPYNHIIYFEINVVENVANQSNEGLVIGLICIAVYAVLVSILAFGIYFKLSKDLKLKDQRVYFEAPSSSANHPTPDGTYITIDDVKSSPAEHDKPTEYLSPNEINSETHQPLPADGYENTIVAENEDMESKREPSTKASYENFAMSESEISKKTKNPSSSKPSDEYVIMNPQTAQK